MSKSIAIVGLGNAQVRWSRNQLHGGAPRNGAAVGLSTSRWSIGLRHRSGRGFDVDAKRDDVSKRFSRRRIALRSFDGRFARTHAREMGRLDGVRKHERNDPSGPSTRKGSTPSACGEKHSGARSWSISAVASEKRLALCRLRNLKGVSRWSKNTGLIASDRLGEAIRGKNLPLLATTLRNRGATCCIVDVRFFATGGRSSAPIVEHAEYHFLTAEPRPARVEESRRRNGAIGHRRAQGREHPSGERLCP